MKETKLIPYSISQIPAVFGVDLPLPKGWMEYIEKQTIGFNFLYGKKNGKGYDIHCTHCKSDYFEQEKHIVGSFYHCPKCGLNLKYLNGIYRTKARYGSQLIGKFDRYNNSIVYRTFHITTSITPDGGRKNWVLEVMRDIFNLYDHRGSDWQKISKGIVANMSGGLSYTDGRYEFYGEYDALTKTYQYDFVKAKWKKPSRKANIDLYPTKIYPVRNELKETPFEYAQMSTIAKQTRMDRFPVPAYLKYYLENPKIEMLIKSGFAYLLGDIIESTEGSYRHPANFSDTDTAARFTKIIMKNRIEFKKKKPSLLSIVVFSKIGNIDTAMQVVGSGTGIYNYYEELMQYLPIEKVLAYLKGRGESSAMLYRDYLDTMKKLGMYMNGKIMFPPKLREAHDEAMERLKEIQTEKIKNLIQEVGNRLIKYSFQKSHLIIRPAMTYEDLQKEGKKLSHCVARNYAEPYANGKTMIFLVRQEEQPDEPFVTVEYRGNKVIQARGKENHDASEDIKKFLDKWQEFIRTADQTMSAA